MISNLKLLVLLLTAIFLGNCEQLQSSFGGSSHNAGTACMASGCHSGGEKNLTVAGTVYTDSTGTVTAGGMNITVNAGGMSLEVDRSGNFYSGGPVGFPSSATTSTGQSMSSQVTSGDCNKSGCHDAAKRIFK